MNRIKKWLLLGALCLGATFAQAEDGNLRRLVARMIPKQEQNIQFERIASEKDLFELETLNGKLIIRGNNGVSMARGLNHYMRHYLHRTTTWTGDNLPPVASLPKIKQKVRIEATLPLRYALNYCTYSYSMAFWTWEQWEEEIDRMAMQGINTPLVAVLGQYAVWQQTLRQFGYSEKEILEFLPGPGYEAWWLMGNLEGFGGTVSQQFIDRQVILQQKMLTRMREYGMAPVLQGFYGMVPNNLIQKYPESDIRSTGKWFMYQRPAFLVPTDPLFDKMARVFYQEQERLFGEARYFAGDLFHEGGSSKGINLTEAATAIYRQMKEQHPQAVWIVQGWGENPSNALMEGLQPGETIILDLMACVRPQWGGVPSSPAHKEGGYGDHAWIWNALPNFGGRIGLYGTLQSYATGVVKAAQHPLGKRICGIGTAPEGIGTNPINNELVYDMAWQKDTMDVAKWITDYTWYRYGVKNNDADAAMQLLANTVYNCPLDAIGQQESYFCARPSLKVDCVSAWGTTKLYYDPKVVSDALGSLLKAEKKLQKVDTYRYDVVDLARQMLADYAKQVHSSLVKAYEEKDSQAFERYTSLFMEMIHDQDRLLGTRKEFLVGRWIRQAADCGFTLAEKEQYVRNAKLQISTWTSDNSSLSDYGHREWNGLLATYYASRWEAYFTYLRKKLEGKNLPEVDFFAMETEWVDSKKEFPTEPTKKELEMVKRVYKKYAPLL